MATFKQLWDNYPDTDPCDAKDKKGEKLFGNQCAIRLSYSMKNQAYHLFLSLKKESAGYMLELTTFWRQKSWLTG